MNGTEQPILTVSLVSRISTNITAAYNDRPANPAVRISKETIWSSIIQAISSRAGKTNQVQWKCWEQFSQAMLREICTKLSMKLFPRNNQCGFRTSDLLNHELAIKHYQSLYMINLYSAEAIAIAWLSCLFCSMPDMSSIREEQLERVLETEIDDFFVKFVDLLGRCVGRTDRGEQTQRNEIQRQPARQIEVIEISSDSDDDVTILENHDDEVAVLENRAPTPDYWEAVDAAVGIKNGQIPVIVLDNDEDVFVEMPTGLNGGGEEDMDVDTPSPALPNENIVPSCDVQIVVDNGHDYTAQPLDEQEDMDVEESPAPSPEPPMSVEDFRGELEPVAQHMNLAPPEDLQPYHYFYNPAPEPVQEQEAKQVPFHEHAPIEEIIDLVTPRASPLREPVDEKNIKLEHRVQEVAAPAVQQMQIELLPQYLLIDDYEPPEQWDPFQADEREQVVPTIGGEASEQSDEEEANQRNERGRPIGWRNRRVERPATAPNRESSSTALTEIQERTVRRMIRDHGSLLEGSTSSMADTIIANCNLESCQKQAVILLLQETFGGSTGRSLIRQCKRQ